MQQLQQQQQCLKQQPCKTYPLPLHHTNTTNEIKQSTIKTMPAYSQQNVTYNTILQILIQQRRRQDNKQKSLPIQMHLHLPFNQHHNHNHNHIDKTQRTKPPPPLPLLHFQTTLTILVIVYYPVLQVLCVVTMI